MNAFLSARSALVAACVALCALGLLTRCASMSPPTPPPDATAAQDDTPDGVPLSLLYTDATGLQAHDVRTETVTTLAEGVTFTGPKAVSPSGRYLAMRYAADSSHLGIVDLQEQTLHPVHAHPDSVVYSLAWHPDGDTLAFGVYTPTAAGDRGPGSIRKATPDGISQSVGCQVAREVLTWLPTGALATRDDETLYLVDATDCATQASLDIRKMHHLTYAADGSHLAYIFRDLAYDRSAGEYVPDSSLYVSDPQGQAATKLFGDARRVRHLTWAPEGATLAFDLRADDADRRQVVVYDAAQERTSYVVPPGAAASYDHVQPRWAPDASRVAFTRRSGTQQTAAVRAAGQTQGLGTTVAPVWGWADARHVVVPGPDSLRVTTVRGQTVHALPRGVNLIQAEMASGV